MKKICMCYDLETTGLNYSQDEIVQFSAIFIDENHNEVERVNVFHATTVSDYILNLHGKTQEFYNSNGLSKTDFINKINKIIDDYNPCAIIGHNIVNFDNKWLKYHCKESATIIDNAKIIDTRLAECDKYNINQYGRCRETNKLTGIKTTLNASCKSYDIHFDEDEAHDGMYDCVKTLELYYMQNPDIKAKYINKVNVSKNNDKINDNKYVKTKNNQSFLNYKGTDIGFIAEDKLLQLIIGIALGIYFAKNEDNDIMNAIKKLGVNTDKYDYQSMALNLNYIIADYEKNNKCDFCFRENKCKSIIVQYAIDPILIKKYGHGDIEKQHANRYLQQLLELVERK